MIANDDSVDNDYDLKYDSDVVKIPVTTPAAERLLGGADGFQTYMREQRNSTTRSSDMLADIEPRTFETFPIKEMATPIESTRRVHPKLFGLGSQTGPPQAQPEVKRSTTEREFQLESLARDLLSELNALKNTVSSMKAMHGKEVEAIRESYERVIGMRPPEDKSKSTRAMMDDKVPIKVLKRTSAVQVENSLYNVKGALEQMGLLDVAEGKKIGSTDDEMRIKRAMLRWIGDDERMLSSMRTKLGQEAKGTILLEHIITYYVEPMIGDARSAETKFQAFDYSAPFGGDEANLHKDGDEFVNIVSHLSAHRQGDQAEWVQHLSDRVPADLYTEYDRFLRTLTTSQQRMACEDVTAFALYLGKALTRLRERTPLPALSHAEPDVFAHKQTLSMHQQRDGQLKRLVDVIPGHARLVGQDGVEFNACPDCYFKWCLKANDPSGKCDVCDDVKPERALELEKRPMYKDKVIAKRKVMGKTPIVFGLKTNIHKENAIGGERRMIWGDEMFALIDSLAKEDEPVEEEAPQSNFKGFRQEFFEAREESALRLGTYEDK
jgi:hypothetical protein